MLIEDTFRVRLPIEDAWKYLLDVERIAPCMPGAELQEIEGEEYRGIVKVKVGPITAQYKGTAVIETADEAARRIVLKASGRDTRGQGNASASVTANLTDLTDGQTEVAIATDLTVTGKVAQFGRGVMQEVSTKLLGQFVQCIERDIVGAGEAPGRAAASSPLAQSIPADAASTGALGTAASVSEAAAAEAVAEASAAAGSAAATGGARRIDSAPAQPVDLVAVSAPSLVKRLIPPVLVVLVLFLLRRRRRKG
jgi:carbon monoxide dehydrogenase subunit G